jgi:superfamily II DNA/RNA helicase
LKVSHENHVIVGTPKKIFDIITKSYFKPKVDISRVRYFVADEADDLMQFDNASNSKNYQNVMGIINKIPQIA